MNTNKFYDFFKPDSVHDRIHIIGCGAIGSILGDSLARLGLTKITLYDFDTVEEHNIANQMYTEDDLRKPKVEALAARMRAINPQIGDELVIEPNGYKSQRLSGYVFLCVDSIDLRRSIVQEYQYNQFIKAMFDFRMRLVDAQHFAADWTNSKAVQSLLNSMQFTSEEAQAETPVSACNLTLSVIPTVQMVVACGVSNFMNYVLEGKYHTFIKVNAFEPSIAAF